jgi:hypothetical protein
MLHVIERIEADPATYHLSLRYRGQPVIRADFKPLIDRGGVMAGLRAPAVFATARIGARGRSLAWGEDIEFCADGLWERLGHAGRVAAWVPLCFAGFSATAGKANSLAEEALAEHPNGQTRKL